MRAGSFRGCPASHTSTRRRHRPSTSAALRPAGPPPTMMASSAFSSGEGDGSGTTIGKLERTAASAEEQNQDNGAHDGNYQRTNTTDADVREQQNHSTTT